MLDQFKSKVSKNSSKNPKFNIIKNAHKFEKKNIKIYYKNI